jgi:hypothetical protein
LRKRARVILKKEETVGWYWRDGVHVLLKRGLGALNLLETREQRVEGL